MGVQEVVVGSRRVTMFSRNIMEQKMKIEIRELQQN